MAQVHHAGFQLAWKYYDDPRVKEYVEEGLLGDADHFSTCITLSVNKDELTNIIKTSKNLGYLADVIIDPTYPYLVSKEIALAHNKEWVSETCNGDMVVMLRQELTCGYTLIDKDDPLATFLFKNFPLMN